MNIAKNSQTRKDLLQSEIDAIVIIALKAYRSTLIVHTLRHVGHWNKPIYVLTDKAEKEKERLGDDEKIFFIQPEYNIDLDYYIWSKWIKTQLFEFIPQEEKTILYMDADICILRDLSLFLYDIQQNQRHMNNCDMSMFPERWYTNSNILSKHANSGLFNSGIMLLNRHSSKNILREWSQLLQDSNPLTTRRDQPLLTRAIKKLDANICGLPHRPKYVLYEADIMDQIFWRLGLKEPTFRHFSSQKDARILNQFHCDYIDFHSDEEIELDLS